VQSLLASDPNNVDAFTARLNLELLQRRYKDAFKTADELVRIDTALATVQFYTRMAGAAQADSNPAMYIEYLARATKKFPQEASLHMAQYDALNRAGRLQEALEAARRAADADPKLEVARLAAVALYFRTSQVDSGYAYARASIPLVDSATAVQIATAIVGEVKAVYDKHSPAAEWEPVMAAVLKADSVYSWPGTQFFRGVVAANMGIQAYGAAAEAANAKPTPDNVKACAEAARAAELFDLAKVSMGAPGFGGRFNPTAAAEIMKGIYENAAAPNALRTALKCK
jgi:tetratricopeptide (TPR) repeat protein